MKPGSLDLTIYQGATFRYSLQWKTGSPLAPVDLTGATFRMQIRETVASVAVLAELGSGLPASISSPDPANGQIDLYMSAADTAALSFTTAVYDLEITLASGDVVRLLAGKVTLSKEVTR